MYEVGWRSDFWKLWSDVGSVTSVPTFQLLVVQRALGSFPWGALSFAAMWLELIGFSHAMTALSLSSFAIGCCIGGWVGDKTAVSFPTNERSNHVCPIQLWCGCPPLPHSAHSAHSAVVVGGWWLVVGGCRHTQTSLSSILHHSPCSGFWSHGMGPAPTSEAHRSIIRSQMEGHLDKGGIHKLHGKLCTRITMGCSTIFDRQMNCVGMTTSGLICMAQPFLCTDGVWRERLPTLVHIWGRRGGFSLFNP